MVAKTEMDTSGNKGIMLWSERMCRMCRNTRSDANGNNGGKD